ncbi:MAG: pilin [Candidatus Pacebacteria bacterium]|nr:pilin [Candidatus Paceibacterota bacterium]MCF7857317.1 pilin [Candidatus Paceibacterota bacterium]
MKTSQTLLHSCWRFLIFVLSFFFFPFVFIHGATPDFTPLVGLPGLPTSGATIPDYINAVYKLAIGLGAMFAVIRISWAGVRYSTTDSVSGKSSAKSDIKGVLFGLILLLAPYLVLNEINPNLTNIDVLRTASDIALPTPISSGGGPSGSGSNQNITNYPTGTRVTKTTIAYCHLEEGCAGNKDLTYNIQKMSDTKAECDARQGSTFSISDGVAECLYFDKTKTDGVMTCPSGMLVEVGFLGSTKCVIHN